MTSKGHPCCICKYCRRDKPPAVFHVLPKDKVKITFDIYSEITVFTQSKVILIHIV